MGVRLPAEYQEVEYLESNGSQYIITDYYPTSQSEITVKYLITSAPSGQKQIAGVINNRSGVNKLWAINFIRNNGTSITFAGNQIAFNTNVQSVNTVYTAKISADGFYLNGTKMGDFGAVSEKVSDHPLYLFRENTVTSSSLSPMIGRIYEASTENPVFIPCYRKFDSKPGMYNPVEGKFYTNAGTGEFVVGPDVIDSISPWLVARRRMLMKLPRLPAAYREVEWIQGDGSAWIDTGFAPNQDSRIIQKGSNDGWQMTVRDAATGTKRWEVIYTSTGYVRSAFGDATVAEKTSNFSLDAIVTTDKNKRICTVSDGTKTVTLTNAAKTFQCNANYYIGAHTYPGISGDRYKYYYVAIWDDGIPYGEYIPCYRQSDGAVGVYDIVTKTFLPNIGTGAFTTGPKVIN